MPDEERTRFIKDFRWCPYSEMIQPWEEGQENGCHWCDVDTDSLGPHLKLVLARAADESYAAYERLRDHVNTLSYAEMGEPESVVAQMWGFYTAACKSKTYVGQITNLVRGLAQAALIAVGNGRWARAEHDNAIKLHEALTAVLEATKPGMGDWLSEEVSVVLDAAHIVLRDTKLLSQRPEPPFAVDLDFPVPDPEPDPATDPYEAPEADDRISKMHAAGNHLECHGDCNPAHVPEAQPERYVVTQEGVDPVVHNPDAYAFEPPSPDEARPVTKEDGVDLWTQDDVPRAMTE